jgi:hydroxysqualene dehydroxylase
MPGSSPATARTTAQPRVPGTPPSDVAERRPLRRVVVLGGGLAGLTAACSLAAEGVSVTVLEARRRLGGATFSFERTVAGERVTVDNGQHVVLRCYERYRALLDRLDTADRLRFQPRLRIPVITSDGHAAVLGRPGPPLELPPPAHMALGIARYRLLGIRERVGALRAASALARLDPTDPDVDARSFGDWLTQHGQGDRVRQALWNLITVAALNAAPEDASLALAAMVLRTAFVDGGRDGADIGVPLCPLDDLHVTPAERYVVARGGQVLTGATVRAVTRDGDGWSVHHDRGRLVADAVVLAVGADAAADLLPPGTLPDPARLRQLGSSPIVSVQVWFDRPVLGVPFVATVGTSLPWIFAPPPQPLPDQGISGDQGISDGRRAGERGPQRQYLTAPISAADAWIDLPAPQIRALVVPALTTLLPGARRASMIDVTVTRERAATFAQRPGTLPLRPPARTALPGLALAGAWTGTGWPDTIEGAVRSGEAAAAVVRTHLASLPQHTGRGA